MNQWHLDHQLLEASKFGDAAACLGLIERGADVDACDFHEKRPLHLAAERSRTEVVRLLIECKADVNAKEKSNDPLRGKTPLHRAAQKGDAQSVAALIAAGADWRAQDEFGSNALHCAAITGMTQAAIALIDGGAEVNSKCGNLGSSALHQCGKVEFASALLDRGADLQAKDDVGRTPLHCAAMNHNETTAAFFIDRGADLDCKSHLGETPLHLAADAHQDATQAALVLLERGADVHARNNRGQMPIELTAIKFNRPTSLALIAHGADASHGLHEYKDLSMHQAAILGGFKRRLLVLLRDHPSDKPGDDSDSLIKFATGIGKHEAAALIQSHLAMQAIASLDGLISTAGACP